MPASTAFWLIGSSVIFLCKVGRGIVPKVDHTELLCFSEQLLLTGGMPQGDAELVARLLVKADLRGYSGHGVTRIPSYLAWTHDGTIDLLKRPKITREGKITAVIEGNHYIGQVAACTAMELAIKKAKEYGAGIVCLRHASHTGRLADYMEMAADAGMIAMGAVSVGAGTTTLYGGMERVTGTNPIAFGIPARDGRHIILDFATAAISMGELQKRVARKQPIPEGVMLDSLGHPTTDFRTFRGPPRGVFLPFGGYKGSGVAMITEILGGILTGNGLGSEWWKNGGHGINGVFLQAFAVGEFQEPDTFYQKVEKLISFIKSIKPASGFTEVLVPGENGRRKEEQQRQTGVEIDTPTWSRLQQLATELGVTAVATVPN
jgi:LDH2 family malate/lactate/ureidoglycolate dehydrogenase